jgi:hypothetical protein
LPEVGRSKYLVNVPERGELPQTGEIRGIGELAHATSWHRERDATSASCAELSNEPFYLSRRAISRRGHEALAC